ncbi:hypothetical protein SAY86_005487 [Trapa natans]|uniref:Rho GDP-dissociation inhibitor 1-like n=1 Tax=Trapa natans TaxID=22666 RepID=A0AAN7L303_TRANT|nr:hypothetical protein SAY86_005487 [Trapa natans]
MSVKFFSVPKDQPRSLSEMKEMKFKISNDRRAVVDASAQEKVAADENKSLKEQIEKDKGYEVQRGWKQLLLGSSHGPLTVVNNGGKKESSSEVHILSLAIQCSGRSDLVLPIPILSSSSSSSPSSKRTLFVLKEGSRCRTKFSFLVLSSAVSGLRYTYAVWKTGVRGEIHSKSIIIPSKYNIHRFQYGYAVGNTKIMVGTFSPRKEPYWYETEEETIPTGILARGSYFVRTKFVDDDGKCHLELNYYFEIRKNWQ